MKKILALAMVLSVLGSLIGCSGGSSDSAAPADTAGASTAGAAATAGAATAGAAEKTE